MQWTGGEIWCTPSSIQRPHGIEVSIWLDMGSSVPGSRDVLSEASAKEPVATCIGAIYRSFRRSNNDNSSMICRQDLKVSAT